MSEMFDRELEERLVRYARVSTGSDESSPTTPSTERQYELSNMLAEELRGIGAEDVQLTGYGAVLATVPATVDADVPTVAFLAHVDTTEAYANVNVEPIVHRGWDGSDIVLPKNEALVLSANDRPYLAEKVGHDIITASGDTLLGADDKAGVAIIMTLAKHLIENRDIRHGPIRVCFTPDEEIGRGVHEQLPQDLQAHLAYTLDGAEVGEIVFETFSADKAVVNITGVSAHPGDAKGKLVNALHLASKIVQTLPQVTRTPETTDERDGFIHVYQMDGNAAAAQIQFILRDFEMDGLEAHGDLLRKVCDVVQAGEPRASIACEITPQYRNMRYWLENDMRPVELANDACRKLGIAPFGTPTRGGTDGSRLTEMGVPTPNIFTGMQDIHGPLEWISVQDMRTSTEVLLELSKLWGEQASSTA